MPLRPLCSLPIHFKVGMSVVYLLLLLSLLLLLLLLLCLPCLAGWLNIRELALKIRIFPKLGFFCLLHDCMVCTASFLVDSLLVSCDG